MALLLFVIFEDEGVWAPESKKNSSPMAGAAQRVDKVRGTWEIRPARLLDAQHRSE
jgi:hypothetical protein